jgi:hypothetical protein
MNQILFLFIILVLAVGFPLVFKISETMKNKEGYVNYTLDGAVGDYPFAQSSVLVQDSYPSIGVNSISNNDAKDIWWHYPVFKVGSYKQITNNLKYPNNPDNGTCTPSSFCGALYHKKQLESNYVNQLPPVDPNCGTRVGYFTTDDTLLPFRTDDPNVLY